MQIIEEEMQTLEAKKDLGPLAHQDAELDIELGRQRAPAPDGPKSRAKANPVLIVNPNVKKINLKLSFKIIYFSNVSIVVCTEPLFFIRMIYLFHILFLNVIHTIHYLIFSQEFIKILFALTQNRLTLWRLNNFVACFFRQLN